MPRTEGAHADRATSGAGIARPRLAGRTCLALATLFFLLLSITPITNNDTWMHVVKGRWIVENLSYPDADPFSFMTAGRSDTAVDWLSGVVLYLFERAGGAGALIVLKAAVFGASFLLVLRVARRRLAAFSRATDPEVDDARGASGTADTPGRPGTAGIVSLFLALLLGLAGAQVRFLERPEMFSFLFTALFLDRLDRHDGRDFRSLALVLVPVQWLWTQMHGSFVLGFALAGLAFGLRAETWRSLRAFVSAAVLLAGLVAVSTLHPEGPGVLLVPFTHQAPSEMEGLANFEWRSLFSGDIVTYSTPTLAVCIQALVLAIGAVPLVRTGRLRAWEGAALVLLFALGVRHHRNAALFALFAIPAVALAVRAGLARVNLGSASSWLGVAAAWLAAGAFAGACVLTIVRGWPIAEGAWKKPGWGVSNEAPVAGARFLRDAEIRGRGYTAYTFGAYALHARHPEVTVFIDSRNRMVYPPEVYEAYQSARLDPVRTLSLFTEHEIDFAWIPLDPRTLQSSMQGVAEYLRRTDEWVLVHIDDRSLIYVREGGANDELARRAPGKEFAPYHALDPIGYRQGMFDRRPDAEVLRFDRESARLIEKHPDSCVAILLRAEVLIGRGYPVRAVKQLDRLLAIDPGHPYALLNRASLARTAGEFDLEAELVARFKRLYPGKLPD